MSAAPKLHVEDTPLAAPRTSVRTEIVAGIVTFMTMAYILFVNPSILGNAPGADKGAIIVGTGLVSGNGYPPA
jgi:adenine/guanine/hypoxanthine permease